VEQWSRLGGAVEHGATELDLNIKYNIYYILYLYQLLHSAAPLLRLDCSTAPPIKDRSLIRVFSSTDFSNNLKIGM